MRYGLLIAHPRRKGQKKGTLKVKYLKAKNASEAKKKFYRSAYHFKTESIVLQARKIPKGYKMTFGRGKKKRR